MRKNICAYIVRNVCGDANTRTNLRQDFWPSLPLTRTLRMPYKQCRAEQGTGGVETIPEIGTKGPVTGTYQRLCDGLEIRQPRPENSEREAEQEER